MTSATASKKRIYSVNEKLKPFLVSISQLKADPRNARRHPDRNIQAIADSLEQFKQQIPIIHQNNIVIKGNGTLEAAKKLGWTHIAAIPFQDVDKSSAFAMADNRSGELAEWDLEQLSDNMRRAIENDFDMTKLGWEAYEYEPLMAADWNPPEPDKNVSFSVSGGVTIKFTKQEFVAVASAIALLRRGLPKEKQQNLTDAAAVVSICRAYGR